MRVTLGTTVEGLEHWQLHLEVPKATTIRQLKELLARPPHLLGVTEGTKVLCRERGVLTTLNDSEKVQSYLTLLRVNNDKHLPFPDDFIWGSATSAYQIEGAAASDGRSPSIWDRFAAEPNKVKNGDTGEIACDHYHRYVDDVKLMNSLHLGAYRFSISWSRLLPQGRGDVNEVAYDFYNKVLDELHKNGIMPVVTLYHWDLPDCLESEYEGWRSRQVIDDFVEFADTCFRRFGGKVRRWITLNEPWCAAVMGYATGEHAPGRAEAPEREPYLVAHHMILAHAAANRCYCAKYKEEQGGLIGITVNMDWKEPLRPKDESDRSAQRRAVAWQLGWFLDPLWKGQYPEVMRERCGTRLPDFSESEKELVKGSLDFLGLNHYSSDFVTVPDSEKHKDGYFQDQEVKNERDPLWKQTDIGWDIVPWGLHKLLCKIKEDYPGLEIYITENGACLESASKKEDVRRVEYLQGYLAQVHKAIEEGAPVKGYFAWSLMDNFEWQFGYSMRFGIVRVDFKTQERTLKESAKFVSSLASKNVLRIPQRVFEESHYAPFNSPPSRSSTNAAGEEAELPEPTRPPLSTPEATLLLKELCGRYQEEKIQDQIVAAFKEYLVSSDTSALSKAKRRIFMPVQADVMPKYGFEPTFKGVLLMHSRLQDPNLHSDPEVAQLLAYIVYLTDDWPKEKAIEGSVG